MPSEFDLIERITKRVSEASFDSQVVLGIGDDAAVVQASPGMQLVATADNLVQGRHFDDRATPQDLGHLALAVNLSDLAAMGATPRWSLLTLTLPEADSTWLDHFIAGYLTLSQIHDCALVGGNITRGPLNIAVTALGEVRVGGFVSRTGAQVGDRIVVTGTLGDAAAALEFDHHGLRQRLVKPGPRVEPGRYLAKYARAMIDVSDGLLADLRHVLDGHGAQIELDALPASDSLRTCLPSAHDRWLLQLNGGSDYELVAVLPAEAQVPKSVGDTPLTEIGRITASGRIECIDSDNQTIDYAVEGWDHFRS